MLNLKQALRDDIAAGVAKAVGRGELAKSAGDVRVVVTRTDDAKRDQGDYASPIAMALAKAAKLKPMDVVEVVAAHMEKKEYIGSLEAAAPGFLNISISRDWLASRIDDIIESPVFSGPGIGGGRHVNLEFISANPTGPLTFGNVRTAFSADTFGNVLERAGYNVTREYYVNDAGNQVRILGESVLRRILQAKDIEVDFPETLYRGDYIKDIAERISDRYEETEGHRFSAKDLENATMLQDISREAMEQCLSAIKTTVHDDLHIHFDVWTSESAIQKSGVIERTLDTLREKGKTVKEDGAEFLNTMEYGDEKNRALVKKDGTYTYFAPDIAYHNGKYERKFDLMFTYLGADHAGHVPRMVAAMKMLGRDTDRLHFVLAQFLRFVQDGKTLKFSKRKGVLLTPKELIGEVGYDVARYFMVQHALTSHMDFDLDLAKDKSERNPVFYVQYAYVRLQSIIRKAKEQGIISSTDAYVPVPDGVQLTDPTETQLLMAMFRLQEVVDEIAVSYNVHILPYYAYELARAVHAFYNDVHVLNETDRHIRQSRIEVIFAARKVLGEVLDILGIARLDVM